MVVEQVVTSIFENSLIGGAFVYLLYYITKNFKEALDKNTEELSNISETLKHMDRRIEKLEKRTGD